MAEQRIAVIGGGPMGLAVAYQLSKDGYQPFVFEADDRVGGMAASFDFDGQVVERYYHFHCISDKAFLQVLDECGLAKKMRWKETKMGVYVNGLVHPWGNPLALLRFPYLSLIAKLRYGLHAFYCTKRSNWNALDRLAAVPWLQRWVGQEAYELLWDKLFAYKFYKYSRDVSAAWIWSRIRRIGRSRYDLFREKLGHLDGGSETLLQAMRGVIEDGGGQILLRSPVERVAVADGRVKGVVVNGSLRSFETVISTVPLPIVPRMIPDLPEIALSQYRKLKNVAVVCVVARLAKQLTGNFWLNVNDKAMDFPGLVEYTNLRPMNGHIVYVPFYLPADHPNYKDPNIVFETKVRKYLQQINPSLISEDFLGMRTHRYRNAQPVCEPGHLDKLPPIQPAVKGLLIADTSYYYPEDRGISESIRYGRKLAKILK